MAIVFVTIGLIFLVFLVMGFSIVLSESRRITRVQTNENNGVPRSSRKRELGKKAEK